jgi:hypothetical protein
VARGAAAETCRGGGGSNVSAAAATGSSVANGGGGGSKVSSAAATVAAAASGKFPKLLPGQSTLDEALGTVVKTPAPTRGNQMIAAHHPSAEGFTLSGDKGRGGTTYHKVLKNGITVRVTTTITNSDGYHRVASLERVNKDGTFEVFIDLKLKHDLNCTHRKEGVYDGARIAELQTHTQKRLKTDDEKKVVREEGQVARSQKSYAKKRAKKEAELDTCLKEEKERIEERRKQNMALLEKTHVQRGYEWRAAEMRDLPDEYFPGVTNGLAVLYFNQRAPFTEFFLSLPTTDLAKPLDTY